MNTSNNVAAPRRQFTTSGAEIHSGAFGVEHSAIQKEEPMPIYQFACPKCRNHTEEIRKVGDFKPPTCTCGRKMELTLGAPFLPSADFHKVKAYEKYKGQASPLEHAGSTERGEKIDGLFRVGDRIS